MGFKMKKYFKIFLHFQRLNLMRRAAYPASFLVVIFTVILVMFFNLLFYKINFSFMSSLAGWSFYQIAAVLGSYMIVEGLMWGLCGQLNSIQVHIRNGTLDGVILKPVDDQFLATFWSGDIEDVARVITGFLMLFYSASNTVGFSLLRSMLFLVMIIGGTVCLYSLNLIFRSVSFWLIDGSGLWMLTERLTADAKYPTDIFYHKIAKNIFTFIIPLAFISTVPARIWSFEIIDYNLFFLSVFTSATFFLVSRFFWKFSLKRYSSASS
jgi:ABC-2 type transport system permease protein